METGPKIIEFYVDSKGRCPFTEWFFTLKDARARGKIVSRLDLLESGFAGKSRILGVITEAKIDYGPGYRIYFAEKEGKIVVILGGGDKSTQSEDIDRAEKLWEKCRGPKWREVVKTIARGIFRI